MNPSKSELNKKRRLFNFAAEYSFQLLIAEIVNNISVFYAILLIVILEIDLKN